MPRQIVITFNPGADIHRVRNFNDSLFYIAREDDWMWFGLDQLDKATDQRVTVKSKRRVHQALAKIEKLIAKHGFTGIAHTSVIIITPTPWVPALQTDGRGLTWGITLQGIRTTCAPPSSPVCSGR